MSLSFRPEQAENSFSAALFRRPDNPGQAVFTGLRPAKAETILNPSKTGLRRFSVRKLLSKTKEFLS
ncbi:MAG: hypothetical protein B6245_18755 [Desulfobacteraceae bacterium 4572_88]|nr:MAG: hypothetical protein B6245_18755 [Desulfobacteraceae bacterium 4572_88]